MSINPLQIQPDSLGVSGFIRLVLTQFRSYSSLLLQCTTKPIIIVGPNGAGKTNILEAISFFSPGRGLRNIRLSEACRHPGSESSSTYPWTVTANYIAGETHYHLGTTINVSEGKEKRIIHVDGEPLKTQTHLTQYLNILWLTPQMDRLFAEGMSTRRKFYDRLVYGFDASHATRLNRYDYFMRERNRLLQQYTYDPSWMTVLEQKMAAESVAIAAARKWVLQRLHHAEAWMLGVFPQPQLHLLGQVELLLDTHKALDVEDILARQWSDNRHQDRAAGRTLEGIHKTDFQVYYAEKAMAAEYCSTGEQKALLVSIIMMAARLQAQIHQCPPILLLDEIAAHLDEQRRHALYDEIIDLKMQTWITGTDNHIFAKFADHAHYFAIENGAVKSL